MKTYPAHAERLKAIVREEAYRMIGVRDGRREVKVPMAQAIVRALAVSAVKGQQRAHRLFTELLRTTERENKRTWDRELAVGLPSASSRRSEPASRPHPDRLPHRRLRDLRSLSKEEQAELDVWTRCRQVLVLKRR